jgi:hypothetical protein
MKYVVTILVCFLYLFSPAQESNPVAEIGFRLGLSATGATIRGIDEVSSASRDQSTRVNIRPAISLKGDFFIIPQVSVGLLVSGQRFKGKVLNYEFEREGETVIEDQVDFDLRRRNFSIVPQFHYPSKSEKFDFYSGVRFGYLWWKKDIQTLDRDFKLLDKVVISRINLGFVPIGGTFHLGSGLGVNAEVALGAPYIFSGGLTYRFDSQ